MTSKTRRPTIAEVAQDAEVSIATVSRVITGSGAVSEERAGRVRESIQKLGYRPNRTASNLRSSKATQKVGMIMADINNPFFTKILRGVQTTIIEKNNVLLVGDSMGDPDLEQLHYDMMVDEGVAGFVIQFRSTKEANTLLYDRAIPMVAVDFLSEGLKFDSVIINNREVTKKATGHLIGLGHRNIGFIGAGTNMYTGMERRQGFIAALQEAEIPFSEDQIQGDDFTLESGYEAMRALWNLPQRPTAVLTSNDYTTTGAIHYISQQGLRIPEDIAFIGFDDRPWMSAICPPLTVVDQHPYHIGTAAAELLMKRIADPQRPIQKIVLEADLIIRGSCGADI